MNIAACLICGAALKPAPSLPTLACCASCGFVTADVRISDEELESLYRRNYFHGNEYADYVREAPSLQHNFALRLEELSRRVMDPRQASLFEIGCAYGFFLNVARHRFGRVQGIDIVEDGVRHAREALGVDVVRGNFLDPGIGEGFDVYCLWDTIEHLREPHRFIEKIAKTIKPNGLLAVTTGDIGSLNARIRGRRWRMIHPPSHLHYFSRRTLTELLKRFGFEVIYVQYPGVSRTLRMILSGLLVLGRAPTSWTVRLFRSMNWLPFLDVSVSINLYDIMYVIARKESLSARTQPPSSY